MTTEAKRTGKDVRQRIAEDAGRLYEDKISAFFEEALSAEKAVWGTCAHCRHKVEVNVPDWASRTRTLGLLLDQGFGRPQLNQENQSVTLVVQRMWPPPDLDVGELLDSWRPDPQTWARLVALGWLPPPPHVEDAA